jgi:hypothetical protein
MRWWKYRDPPEAPLGRVWRRYALDDCFFDVVDTEAKAYWLGFINADGCVQAGPVGARGRQRHALSVKLQGSDAGHLRKLKADLAAESPVYFVPAVQQTEIVVSSRHLVESLISLGVTPRKSLTATPWDGPEHLMRHYWRGMVDGDGTIVKHGDRSERWHIGFLGSEAVVEAFRVWATAVTGSAAKKYPKANIWSWKAGGLASPQALARELYVGSTVYLDRKYELACQLLAAPTRRRSPWVEPAEFCTVSGCEEPPHLRDLCAFHYRRNWEDAGRCTVDGCAKRRLTTVYCSMHYSRVRRSGTVGPAQSLR